MPINSLTHFVLVDFENVPGVDLGVLGNHAMCVTLFLGPKSKLKPGLVEQIATLPCEVRLIKIGQIKKNALAFVLAYHLGQMVSRYPRGHYYIVSGDQDFEPMVTHLRDHNVHITQHKDAASLPFLAVPKAPAAPGIVDAPKSVTVAKPVAPKKLMLSREDKIIAGLQDAKKLNRPSTLRRLLAHIKNTLGKDAAPEKVETIIAKLSKTHLLSIDPAGKVSYK